MDLCEEKEDDVQPSKVSLSVEHGSQTKAKSPVQQERPDSPVPSGVSMKSDHSIAEPLTFRDRNPSTEQRVQQERPDSPVPSGVSMKSDHSIAEPLTFRDGNHSTEQRVHQERSEVTISHSDHEHNEADLASIFMLLEENIITFVKTELKKFQGVLSPDYRECSERQRKDEEVVDGKEEEQRKSSRWALLKITLHFLRRMKQDELADSLQSRTVSEVSQKLKSNLKEKFQCLFEGIAKAGNPTLLNDIYTELYITEGGSGEVNDEHEIRQIETAFRKPSGPETMIKCKDIFQPLPGRDPQPIRTVLTKGVAGIGKTVLTHKFTLDWAEDKANQDIQFTFPFTFRELNVLKEKKYSLVELVHHFFTETKEAGICRFEEFQVVFIFDGLDECRLPLDFHNNEILTDVTESTSVDVLLTNLIRGKLLPSARLWITTRPAAANQIPPECVDMVTEVRGFTNPQKEEYFRKRFREEEQAGRIISHIKTSQSLHIMCHIPVFCWISASVLDHVLRAGENRELPKTLTEMYIHFLVVQSKVGNVKYRGGAETDPLWKTETSKIIMSLGKLAFEQLQKGNLIFYESDLTECGIDIRAASVYSGVFTQIFKEERGLYQDKVFSFVHLSIQEFLAALYVFVTFINTGVNLLSEQQSASCWSPLWDKSKVNPLYQSAVDKTIQSPNGHLDLFLRFLLGFSLEANQTLLQKLMTPSRGSLQNYQETVKYIKKKIRRNPCPERCINLFHCLNELNDHSLVGEIQQYLSSGSLSTDKLSPAQWSALVFILLSSEKDLDVFDLRKYSASEEGLLRLLPVVKSSRISCLRDCKLSERSCEALAHVLESKSSHLKELDLSNNDLQDSGVKLLSVGLRSPHCRLETLRLRGCNLSEKSSEALASISSQSSSLRELDLSNNDLQDSGVKLLSAGLASPQCRLKTLWLSGCQVTEEGCASLASALSINPSHLRELDLSYNHPGDSGVRLLSVGLEDPHWRLDTLLVDHGGRHRVKPLMYACELTLDPNTVNRRLSLSEDNRKVTEVKEAQPYLDHPERFHHWKQVLCRDGLTRRSYWEVEWKGWVNIGVAYKGIKRKGERDECCLGENDKSWGLFCSVTGYSVCHNKRTTDIRGIHSSCDAGRVGVYVDWAAGVLSFYRVSSDTLTHLHTFNTTFTDPLYPVLRFKLSSGSGSSVSLCKFEEEEPAPV
ncbi:NLR family CARD domain-containing protein 3-like isoform X2 [Sebastes umbrosus]|uniref:NLR family CARD domain-containing protein 3-like isoform X2 n=1 Tax=Sebastes umbrosus TaxID=72105 RepID=UPI00189D8CFD|nr:NLR family CARD domain-containing protein 3-like isoform X2 [Sebastes umbrosus]